MGSLRILICDDDDGVLDVCQIILQEKGYEVKTISQPQRVFEEVARYQPDLIILDLWMPRLGGEEVACVLKKSWQTQKIPVMILSANKDIEKSALRCGAAGFLSKPFEIEDLEKMVQKCI